MRQTHRDLILSVTATVLSALTVVTCSAVGTKPATNAPHPPPVAPPSQSVQAELPTTSSKPSASAATAPTTRSVPTATQDTSTPATWQREAASQKVTNLLALARFYDRLHELERGTGKDHVRVAWLGDSHTQADLWTDEVRRRFQQLFGNGGPGFVHVGWTTYGYRHGGIKLSRKGRWHIRPRTLVSVTKVDDGVFGLGGVRLEPQNSGCEASVKVSAVALPGPGVWDLAYRLRSRTSGFDVQIGDKPKAHVDTTAGGDPAVIAHYIAQSHGPGGTLSVSRPVGQVQLLGTVIERTDKYGFVLDTLGLNSARVRTTLVWDAASWEGELTRRHPDLVVIAFGTNESSSLRLRTEVHAARLRKLIARIKAAAPDSDCLVFGPVDRGGQQYERVLERINAAQKLVAQEQGCAFWSGQEAMGGPGSMITWAKANPPLAAPDHVHLFSAGYRKLGGELAGALLASYRAGFDDADGTAPAPAAAEDEGAAPAEDAGGASKRDR